MSNMPRHTFSKLFRLCTGHGVLDISNWGASANEIIIVSAVSWKQLSTFSRSVLDRIVEVLLSVNL